MTTHAEVARSADVQKAFPALAELAARHRRPDGAQHGHDRRLDRERRPGSRLPGRRACLNATVHTNKRTIAADAFFTGLYETALQPGELITAVSFPTRRRRPM